MLQMHLSMMGVPCILRIILNWKVTLYHSLDIPHLERQCGALVRGGVLRFESPFRLTE